MAEALLPLEQPPAVVGAAAFWRVAVAVVAPV
jgi:hypothetical protein